MKRPRPFARLIQKQGDEAVSEVLSEETRAAMAHNWRMNFVARAVAPFRFKQKVRMLALCGVSAAALDLYGKTA
jgi:hypothetical protein